MITKDEKKRLQKQAQKIRDMRRLAKAKEQAKERRERAKAIKANAMTQEKWKQFFDLVAQIEGEFGHDLYNELNDQASWADHQTAWNVFQHALKESR